MFVAELEPVAGLELLDVGDVVAVVGVRSNVHEHPGQPVQALFLDKH